MKMYYGNTPVNSMKIKHYEVSTNDATMVASDLQSGVTAYAKGQKVTGTGKSFEFANYGASITNTPEFVPTSINIVEIASITYPVKSLIALSEMKNIDFSTEQTIGTVSIDGVEYPVSVKVDGNALTFNCDITITLQSFYGRDNYI